MLFLFGKSRGETYNVYAEGFSGVKNGYREGDTVNINFDMIATDTDYSFYIDGQPARGDNLSYNDKRGFVIKFKMPDHDVNVRVDSKNTMVREPSFEENIDRLIAYFETHNKVKFDPYPEYDNEVFEALDLLGPDCDYLSHYDKIEDKPYEKMTKKEIAAMLTFIQRGERFCDGHIAGYVEDGSLLRLMKRLKELVQG